MAAELAYKDKVGFLVRSEEQPNHRVRPAQCHQDTRMEFQGMLFEGIFYLVGSEGSAVRATL